jgi:alpha-glucosidase
MKKQRTIVRRTLRILSGACAVTLAISAQALELKSPDGNLVLSFGLRDGDSGKGVPFYQISFRGRRILAESRLGLELAEGPLGGGFTVMNQSTRLVDSTWKPVCAEKDVIRDHYNEVELNLRQTDGPKRQLRLTFRAYDEGIAFRYTVPNQPGLKEFTITRESTGYAFTADHPAWAVYRAQAEYGTGCRVPLSQIKPGAERPLTVKVADDVFLSITEAGLVDYARMKLRPAPQQKNALGVFLDAERGKDGPVTGMTPFNSPWRVIMVATSAGKLLENNHLILNLNEPCAIKDTSWIKPGKVIRETTLTTAGGKACVDFAVRQGLQFIEYDAGWYGYEYDPKSDARAVHLDPRRNPVPDSLNLQEVIDYGKSKGIGVILYVNHLALERQIAELLPLYEKWGIKGVKYGFVNVGSQQWTRWLHEAIRKAADHHLMVDIHDEFRSTGYQRTYPNLMTVEGILGNEGFPSPVHNATLPFTRFLTGPGDYTFCWYSARLKQTHAHQLALSTIFFSPWQFVYWYDKPSDFDGDPALDYWKRLPTIWDETRVVRGDIGESVSVARRKGNQWFVGSIQPVGNGEMRIPLSFLDAGRKYTATTYSDRDPGNPDSKAVVIETKPVDSNSTIVARMAANGGHAIWITTAGR